MRRTGLTWLLLGTLVSPGCAHTRNYDDPMGPRFAGGIAPARAGRPDLRVVSFNLNYARAPERVAAFLRDSVPLGDADVILLQEADSATTALLAAEVGRAFLYVPAVWHPVPQRDYGNAILSAWPIVAGGKVLLPHLGIWRLSRRAAASATICVGRTAVRIYSTHLGTVSEISEESRREQLATVLDDAEPFPIAIVGGDFNSGAVAETAVQRGYAWPTERSGPTKSLWSVDHVVVRGAHALDAGVASVPPEISDHRPVWVTIRLETAAPTAWCGPP